MWRFVGFLVFWLSLRTLQAQRDAESFCQSISHMSTSSALFTCCGYKNFTPGFVFVDFWNECATRPVLPDEDLHDSLWRVYSCLVRKATSNELSLLGFAVMMTRKYPESYSMRILDGIINFSEQRFNLIGKFKPNAIDRLKQIRSFYYHNEERICQKTDEGQKIHTKSENELIPMPFLDQGCDLHFEHFHSRGGCCKNKTIPISLDFFPRGADQDVSQEWEAILKTVADGARRSRRSRKAERYCFTTSAYVHRGVLRKSELFHPPHLESIIPRLMPPYISSDSVVKLSFKLLAHLGSTPGDKKYPVGREVMYNFEKIYREKLKKEIAGITDENKATALFVNCGVHVLIRNYVLDELNQMCDE